MECYTCRAKVESSEDCYCEECYKRINNYYYYCNMCSEEIGWLGQKLSDKELGERIEGHEDDIVVCKDCLDLEDWEGFGI